MDKIIPDQPHSIPYQEYALRKLFDDLRFSSVLDVGCSSGRMLKLLGEDYNIHEYVGVDLSTMRLKCAENIGKNLLAQGKLKECTLYRGDWLDIDVGNKQFDLVVAIETLMHIPPKFVQTFIDKLLNKTRKYLVTIDYYPRPTHAFKKLADHNFLHDYPKLFSKTVNHYEGQTQISGLQTMFLVKK